jgi:predicted transcriptional regulator
VIHLNIDEAINLFDDVYDDFKFLAISNVRTKIMISLSFGTKNLKILREETSLNSSTILHAMNQLDKKNLVTRKAEFYSLSSTGKITALKLINVIKALSSLKSHQKFWMEHDINGIPEPFLWRIGSLKDSSIIESTNSNLTKPFNTYLKLLSAEKQVKAVSPMFFSHHINHIVEILKHEGKVDIILTQEVLESILEYSNKSKFEKLIKSSRLNIWVTGELGVAFTTTPNFFIMGLFSSDGTYDLSSNLLSHNKDAIGWGNELFDYYRKRSKKVDIKKLTLI